MRKYRNKGTRKSYSLSRHTPRRVMQRTKVPIHQKRTKKKNLPYKRRSKDRRKQYNDDECAWDTTLINISCFCFLLSFILMVIVQVFTVLFSFLTWDHVLMLTFMVSIPTFIVVNFKIRQEKDLHKLHETNKHLLIPKEKKEPVHKQRTPVKQQFVCPICKRQNDKNARFCQDCGSEFIWDKRGRYRIVTASPLVNRDRSKTTFGFKLASEVQEKNFLCYKCGKRIEKTEDYCQECKTKRVTCPICLQYLDYHDIIGYCFYCETLFHYDHLREYIKIKGSCPLCKKHLLDSEALLVTPLKRD